MNIKKLLEEYNLTQEELAVFMGIPRDRIAKWIQDNRDLPPKANDLQIFNVAVNFIAKAPPEEAKRIINKYRIIALNVEPVAGYNATINSASEVHEDAAIYKKSFKENNDNNQHNVDKNLLGLHLKKNDQEMMNRMLGIWEQSNTNVEIIARALDKFGDATKDLAATIKTLVPQREEGEVKKRQVKNV